MSLSELALVPLLLYVNQEEPRAQSLCDFTVGHSWKLDGLAFEPIALHLPVQVSSDYKS